MVDEITSFLGTYPAAVRDLALGLRAIIHGTIPGVQEMLDRPARIVGYAFGTGDADLVCTIIPSQTGVKCGVARGTELQDPHGLMQGTGKLHRYVVFGSRADLKKPGFRPLLRSAAAACKARRGGISPRPAS